MCTGVSDEQGEPASASGRSTTGSNGSLKGERRASAPPPAAGSQTPPQETPGGNEETGGCG